MRRADKCGKILLRTIESSFLGYRTYLSRVKSYSRKEVKMTEERKELDEIKEEENEVIEDVADDVDDNDTGDTLTPSEESSESIEEEEIGVEEKPVQQEKMLTQSQVNELVGRARQEGRESAMKELLERYGVSNDVELNDVFGKGQTYDDLNEEFLSQGNSYKAALAENALLKSKISPDRWEDVKLILTGKGLDVTTDNIESMVMTHPEWRGTVSADLDNGANKVFTPEMGEEMAKSRANLTGNASPLKVTKLGNEPAPEQVSNEEETVKKLFGF